MLRVTCVEIKQTRNMTAHLEASLFLRTEQGKEEGTGGLEQGTARPTDGIPRLGYWGVCVPFRNVEKSGLIKSPSIGPEKADVIKIGCGLRFKRRRSGSGLAAGDRAPQHVR